MKYYRLLLILLLLNTSCEKDFFDVRNNSLLFRQNYITDLAKLNEYLNGIYVELGSSFYTGFTTIYGDIIADDTKPLNNSGIFQAHFDWAQEPTDEFSNAFYPVQNANGLWFSGYRIIRDCNFVIQTVDKFSSSDRTKADNIKGQALGIRALVHFVLSNVFAQPYTYTAQGSHAGIPYVVTYDYKVPVSRPTVAEFYLNLIDDLQNAANLLPETQKLASGKLTKSLINSIAAKSLLARIYLFKEDYLQAKNLSREVSNKVPIMNVPSYPNKLFTEQDAEAIFQVPPALPGNLAGSAGEYTTYRSGSFFSNPLQYFLPTDDVVSILREDTLDVRSQWVSQKTNMSWEVTKFSNSKSIPAATYILNYESIIRSSEIYLMAAECYANLNNEDSARYYLNAIKMRGNPSSNPIVVTGSPLKDSIYKERRKELAFEGFRMYDLLRWKKSVIRMDPSASPDSRILPYPNDRAIAPIPVSEVAISGIAQNPGY